MSQPTAVYTKQANTNQDQQGCLKVANKQKRKMSKIHVHMFFVFSALVTKTTLLVPEKRNLELQYFWFVVTAEKTEPLQHSDVS